MSLRHLLYVDLVIFHHFTPPLYFYVSPASFLLIGSRTFPFIWPTSVSRPLIGCVLLIASPDWPAFVLHSRGLLSSSFRFASGLRVAHWTLKGMVVRVYTRYMEVMGIPPMLHEILCGSFRIPLLDCMIDYVVYVFRDYNKIWTLQTVFSLTWTWIYTIIYKEP